MEAIAKIINLTTHMQTCQVSDIEICKNCGEPKGMVVEILGKERVVPKLCRCEKEALELERIADENREKQKRLERLKKYSMMDDHFGGCTFENFNLDADNKRIYKIGTRYCEKWDEMKKKNVGLMLYGSPGTGKTFVSFAIANKLLEQMVPVIAISSIGLLNKIKDSYNSYGEEGQVEIIKTLSNASLLVIDDLGAENETPWVKSKLYEILDSRYRDGKPLIVTTNLTREQLKKKLTTDDGITRTYDRLVEMCVQIEVKGPSKRIDAAREKIQVINDLLK